MGQCKSEHQGFQKANEKTWESANRRTETLRENMEQCKSKERDFKE
jgi:hypothetical protein